jgi:hypothetical protein
VLFFEEHVPENEPEQFGSIDNSKKIKNTNNKQSMISMNKKEWRVNEKFYVILLKIEYKYILISK